MQLTLIITIFLYLSWKISALENGLARTPPMGWMNGKRYNCLTDCKRYPDECISESLFKRTADLLVSEGYADAGYRYVIIDDCWLERKRDNVTQKLVPDRERFPSGLEALADYIHSKGLLFGLYEDVRTYTGRYYPGIANHMELDAQTFADWKVDYVKLDGYDEQSKDAIESYAEFGRLLNKTERPMVLSCGWPRYQEAYGEKPDYKFLKQHCNLWQNSWDIDDSYEAVIEKMNFFGNNQNAHQPHAGPGHWIDPDMLMLGNYGLSYDQSKIQMAIWAILAAPLMMSNDLTAVQPEIREILQDADIIAVNQDVNGIQGKRVYIFNSIEIWARPIDPISANGHYSYAIAFVNRRQADGAPYPLELYLEDLKFFAARFHEELKLLSAEYYEVKDIFTKEVVNKKIKSTAIFETRVNPSGVNFFIFKPLD